MFSSVVSLPLSSLLVPLLLLSSLLVPLLPLSSLLVGSSLTTRWLITWPRWVRPESQPRDTADSAENGRPGNPHQKQGRDYVGASAYRECPTEEDILLCCMFKQERPNECQRKVTGENRRASCCCLRTVGCPQ